MVTEDVGHVFSSGTPSNAVKWLHEELGYQNIADFAADGDHESLGSEIIFDQTELIPAEWDFLDTEFGEEGMMYVPTECEDAAA